MPNGSRQHQTQEQLPPITTQITRCFTRIPNAVSTSTTITLPLYRQLGGMAFVGDSGELDQTLTKLSLPVKEQQQTRLLLKEVQLGRISLALCSTGA